MRVAVVGVERDPVCPRPGLLLTLLGSRWGLAIKECSYAFHPIEPCVFPKSLAVLFGQPLAFRFVLGMRDKHGFAIADDSWANEVVIDTLVVLRRAATQ